jgi:chromosome segregation ATPase
MAQKTEKLAEDVYAKLVDLQNDINNLVLTIGQAHLRVRDNDEQLKNLKYSISNMETQFDEKNEEMNEVLKTLEQVYPSGEIDLKEGMVTFEETE